MSIIRILQENVQQAVDELYQAQVEIDSIAVQKTRKEFVGDFTVVVFPLLRYSKKSTEQTADEIGKYLLATNKETESFNVVKGFLNICITDTYWINYITQLLDGITQQKLPLGYAPAHSTGQCMMVEYSSPNTNKPLHLGHIRNNLLGYSIAEILKANGHQVIKANLINDRGIHICKSMLAWKKWGKGETPETSSMKGDKLVGKYYVLFDKYYREQVSQWVADGMTQEDAKTKVPLIIEAQEMLKKWEEGDVAVKELWSMMNQWVYTGFKQTYKTLGVDFDNIYYESETYLLGKKIIEEGLSKGILFKKEDGSVWCDLTDEGLDEKLLLRADGTSVYMTQDIGTAVLRFKEASLDSLIYVVGNEQNYHFEVLFKILLKLGYKWAAKCHHLSYGMVDLPSGKLKSREGTVVDADELMQEMVTTAGVITEQLGKLDSIPQKDRADLYQTLGLGALKYFIMKIDPNKRILFQPEASIDFNGNTGPFIQYAYARIQSILRKAADMEKCQTTNITLHERERELIQLLSYYASTVQEAGKQLNPALVANYVYELVKEYNQFYQQLPILKAEDNEMKYFRIILSQLTGETIRSAMGLLGIAVPERM